MVLLKISLSKRISKSRTLSIEEAELELKDIHSAFLMGQEPRKGMVVQILRVWGTTGKWKSLEIINEVRSSPMKER